ncbi:bifunctional diguanylate cyclase/phosphodiesterase [Bacillus mojavensis]|uniref:bifunctional diguanylate cyclase/phosphodiesterase n=1 Tax=Bacillus mojavensis TaxID=72360 RepID=UPI002DB855A6|nr:EAL domain-containing protein [Bacillus mojavensis]MEC1620995.1 EAL domain-containing protein [Bacillus mojavensis]MEC1659002.1 EAL domain-containing protein [Bacillus mojavensis]
MELHVTYNTTLICLSILIACAASFTSLELSRKVTIHTGLKSKVWLFAGSFIMGFGIWSMHFIGMMAVHTEVPMHYELVPLVASIAAAVSGSFVSLYIVSRYMLTFSRLLTGSVMLGASISSMHFIGMSSISRVMMIYEPLLFTLSIVIAIAASFISLKIFFDLSMKKPADHLLIYKIISALIMGIGISGMHYTGMMAATFYKDSAPPDHHMEVHTFDWSILIALIIFCIQTLLLFSSHADRKFMKQNERMKDNEQRFQSLIIHNIDAIFILSLKGDIISSNHAGEDMMNNFGLNHQNWNYYMPTKINALFKQVKSEKQAINSDATLMTDKGQFHLNITFIPVEVNQELDSIYVICKDVTKQYRAEKKIHRMAHYDSLTDLPNRRHAISHLTKVLNREHALDYNTVVFFLDLNRFKVINDALGHNVGDQLLQLAAKRLSSVIPDNGFIARLGGDEFIIILTDANTGTGEADILAKKIIKQFKKPFKIQDHTLITSVSIGIAISPKDGTDGPELMKKADMAMYAAKERNKSKYRYYSFSIGNKETVKLNQEMELREAIDNKRFVLHYQPQFSSKDQKMTGAEALIRLVTPDGNLRAPGEFIGVAEETGLIIDIGKWIIDEACRQAKVWHDKGFDLSVAINISARQFQSEELIPLIKNTLFKYRLPPRLLEVEVTESMTMDNLDHSKKVLSSLTKLGIRISIDDFGMGHSSLSYLKDFPIHRLKIDKSFIDDIQTHPKSEQITGAIIAMGHQLSLQVIAEGVENSGQKQLLDEKGCDHLQGFFFSRPIPPEQLEHLIINQPPR